jgi:hypothetical protein
MQTIDLFNQNIVSSFDDDFGFSEQNSLMFDAYSDGGADYFSRRSERKKKKQLRADNRTARIRKRLTRNERKIDELNAVQNLVSEAASEGATLPAAAIKQVAQNAEPIAQFVQSRGVAPQSNPAALAMQATEIIADEIEDAQGSNVPDFDTAYDAVIENETAIYDGEPDGFAVAMLPAIFESSKALIDKVNEKRVASGKKKIFEGSKFEKIFNKLEQNKTVVNEALTANERAIVAITSKGIKQGTTTPIDAATEAFKGEILNQYVRRYLPIAAIFLGFFILSKASK